MKVVAGLGNPGVEYANTPHSIGFEVVDALAREAGAEWKSSRTFKGELAQGNLPGAGRVLFVKPATYMNLSGDCIAPVLRYHNATAADLLVVSDDIDLPCGRIRIRANGSAGGHNGLKSIIERTGTQGFARLRVGVGRGRGAAGRGVISHVLGKFDPETRKTMDESVSAAAKAAVSVLSDGVQSAMNEWNGWTASAAAGADA